MALYAAYIDESYADDFPVFAVGGYLFSLETAVQMEAEWKDVLGRYNVPFFHMADVNACKGLYEPLGQRGCDDMAREMIALIKRHAILGYAVIANPAKFGGVPLVNNDVYALCLAELLKRLLAWMKKNDADSELAYFFESGHPTSGMASAILNGPFKKALSPEYSKLLGPMTSAEREKVCLLQAADILVWQATKFVKRRANGHRKPRGDFIELVKERHTFAYVDFTAEYHSMYRDDRPDIVNRDLDGWLKGMFRLPPSWEPHITNFFIHYHTPNFGPDLSPGCPKLLPPALNPFWPGRFS